MLENREATPAAAVEENIELFEAFAVEELRQREAFFINCGAKGSPG